MVDVEGSPGEYVDYAKLLQEKDPSCLEENAVAYPRPLGFRDFLFDANTIVLLLFWEKVRPVYMSW